MQKINQVLLLEIYCDFFPQVSGTLHQALWNNLCFTSHPHWIHSEPNELKENNVLQCFFRFQHTRKLVPCKVTKFTEGLTVLLDHNLRALTEGQYAVFYRDNECLGSAKISHINKNLIY